MSHTIYIISDARKTFATAPERANQGDEIIIMRGNKIYGRIGPADDGKRPYGRPRWRSRP
ncbi:prevent-host-death protein, partial [Rhizobium ruizarguesonis]